MSGSNLIDKQTYSDRTILVTGSPGFIGAHLVIRLLREMTGGTVISLDNLNDYYDPALKQYRLREIEEAAASSSAAHHFIRGDIADRDVIDEVFARFRPDFVVHLAAQAGVRYSIDHPDVYIQSNILGFYNLLEACRRHPVRHLVFASSSSVYGANAEIPFRTDARTDEPVSLYAATKKADELLAHSYAKLYSIPCTGLRFFTVYGPAGRPDMFYYSATEKLLRGESIRLYNYGNCSRDFTYIDDITEGILRVLPGAPAVKSGTDGLPLPPFALYNIGNGAPVSLMEFIRILREELVRAELLPETFDLDRHRTLIPMQPGDVPVTYADTTALERDFGYRPGTGLRDGLRAFAEWYRDYKGLPQDL